MNRPLQIVNLIGTVALAGLCVFQWQGNRRLNLQVNQLEKTRIVQEGQIAESARELKGAKADLEIFREQIAQSAAALRDAETNLLATRTKLEIAESDNMQLKDSLTNWMEAVTARDEQLKIVNNQLAQLAEERNSAVVKFNELAETHNKLAKEIEKRAKDYNALVEKYNALAKEK
ncbi:MAG: hypothetical protein ACO1QB_06225 [Verrucomicrobiales bacterium]